MDASSLWYVTAVPRSPVSIMYFYDELIQALLHVVLPTTCCYCTCATAPELLYLSCCN